MAEYKPRIEDADYIEVLEARIDDMETDMKVLKTQRDKAFKALKKVTVHLIGVNSLQHHGGRKAAGSDKMFKTMLADYEKSIGAGLATIKELSVS